MAVCRPLGFLIGLPFGFMSLLLALVGAVIWLIGMAISCLCPCCACFAWLGNIAVRLLKTPFDVIGFFIDLIPC